MKDLSEIDTNRIEGRLLIAALSILSTDAARSSKHPDDVLAEVDTLQQHIYADRPLPDFGPSERPVFSKALEQLINSYSKENGSNTPDFILSDYLLRTFEAFEVAVKSRDNWYGGRQSILDSEKGIKWY